MMAESTNNQNIAKPDPLAASDGGSGSGKALIIGIVLVALLMSGYAWWHQKQKGRHTLDFWGCLLYTSPSPRDLSTSRMPSSA